MRALRVLPVLCCVFLVDAQPSCSSDAPDPCSFEEWDSCDWTRSAGVYTDACLGNSHCVTLSGNHKARLVSQTACSTKAAVHCLTFYDSFEDNDVLDLSVFVKKGEEEEEEVWRMSRSKYWTSARVSINTTSDFRVIFQASSEDDHRVFVDIISYEKDKCSLKPASAAPPAPATSSPRTPTSAASTPLRRRTTPESTAAATSITRKTPAQLTKTPAKLTAVSSQARPALSPVTTEDPANTPSSLMQPADASAAPARAERTASGQPSSNIGLIVGVAVAVAAAVVSLLLVGVGVFILFRRKRGLDWRTCFRKRKQGNDDFAVRASHNPVYGVAGAAAGQIFSVDIHPPCADRTTQQHSQQDQQQHSQQDQQQHSQQDQQQHSQQDQQRDPAPVDDDYSVITHADEDEATTSQAKNVYAKVNTSLKSSSGKQQHYPVPEENPYEFEDSSDAIPPAPASPEDDYNRLDFHRQGQGVWQEGCMLGMDQDDDYNHLASRKENMPQSTQACEESELYPSRGISVNHRDQQPTNELYQNVQHPDTQEPRQGTELGHLAEQASDSEKEGPSVQPHPLPKGPPSSQPKRLPTPGTTPDFPHSSPAGGIYHVLEQTPEYVCPENVQGSCSLDTNEEYNHLNFEGKKVAEQSEPDRPVPLYSHLKEEVEGDYDEIDRNRRAEVIDEDYAHI